MALGQRSLRLQLRRASGRQLRGIAAERAGGALPRNLIAQRQNQIFLGPFFLERAP